MNREGPLLETLTRRLAGCPAEFLALPRVGETGNIHVDAVVADLLRDLGGEGLPAAEARHFQSRNRKADRARLSLVLLAAGCCTTRGSATGPVSRRWRCLCCATG